MKILKATFYSLTVMSVLSLTSFASAYTSRTNAVNGASVPSAWQGVETAGRHTPGHVGETLLGSSSTASFFYKKGVRNFDKGNFDKADKAFKTVLRANGSVGLDALTLRYLIYMNEQRGDTSAVKQYTQAYLNLDKK